MGFPKHEVSINEIVEESGEDEEESEPLQNLPSADHSCSESSYDSQDPLQVPEMVDAWIDPESQTSVTPVCDIMETCDMSQTYDPTTTFYMARWGYITFLFVFVLIIISNIIGFGCRRCAVIAIIK